MRQKLLPVKQENSLYNYCTCTMYIAAVIGSRGNRNAHCSFLSFFLSIFFTSGGVLSLHTEIVQYCTMILQRIRIIVDDAGFEPGTGAASAAGRYQ